MAIRPIRIVGDPVLHNPVRRVEKFDDDLRSLVEDLFETMAAAPGVGLAANQVGVDLRVFVYDCPDEVAGVQLRGVVVNPMLETTELPETMPDPDEDWEGCLSVPGMRGVVPRFRRIRYTGVDPQGQAIDRVAEGFHARVVQHEC
ncbi:peptide deformylase, partial [Actinophytocola sp.]|uniref:peptide deformylase n=1 Tax=Actinophytocola sp. TaxID=1872138 RepID=UPI002ED796AE